MWTFVIHVASSWYIATHAQKEAYELETFMKWLFVIQVCGPGIEGTSFF